MAPTNTASDAIAKSIQAQLKHLGGAAKMIRAYGSSYPKELIPEALQSFHYQWMRDGKAQNDTLGSNPQIALKDAEIIICTVATATLRYETLIQACGVFDLAAFDEAGRIAVAHALAPLTLARTRRAIFYGDHKQMCPFFPQELSGLADSHWDVSILQLLMDIGHPYRQLVANYRSHR